MIVSLMGYGLLVGALTALAAWFVERAQIAYGRPRKYAWIGGLVAAVLVPVLVLSWGEPGEDMVAKLVTAVNIQVQGAAELPAAALPAASPGGEADRGSLNAWLAALWALTSMVLVIAYTSSAWRLQRLGRRWQVAHVDAKPVSVAPDIGPAVFGWRRSQVVFPRWLTEAPEDVQRLALAHEQEHLTARDPQVLFAATLLAALLPWNLPLLWMLRRLRFAMEVDCDAGVIRRGADPNDYGLALLYVSERQCRAPVTAIALIERKSQLERRIEFMFAKPRKPAVIAGLCFALAGYCLASAGQLPAPALATTNTVLKLPPGGPHSPGFQLGQKFELLLRDRYPELLQGQFTGTPVILATLNDDLTVANSMQMPSIATDEKLQSDRNLFTPLGLTPEQVPFTGMMYVQLSASSTQKVLMVYTVTDASPEAMSRLFPDTRQQDRDLFVQQFPDAIAGIEAGFDPWLLMDRRGMTLRKGLERISSKWDDTLEARYKGIAIQEVTVTNLVDEAGSPLRDAAGKQLHLHVAWLAPGSPLPAD